MAKQRPSLNVTATPVSTFVGSIAPAVQLYDQQSVALALELSDAFKDFSLTAAKFAGNVKQELNEEALQQGMDLVNQSQKSYRDLVKNGEIKPTENPWMAIGAQQASGALEGMKARSVFTGLYEQKVREDPTFLDNPDGFNALAAQYAENARAVMGDAQYLSRSFFEAFNPHVATMRMKHEEQVIENRDRKVIAGVGAEFAQVVLDSKSADPIIRNNAIAAFQEGVDNFVKQGYSPKQINEAIIDNAVALMATSEDAEKAEDIFNNLKFGSGYLKDTEYAKAALLANRAKIDSNKQRMTIEESRTFFEWWQGLKSDVIGGKVTQEQALERFNAFVEGPDRKITISGQEAESKRAWILSEIEQGRKEALRIKEEQEDDAIAGLINQSEMMPVDFVGSDADYKGVLLDKIETDMAKYGWSQMKRMQYRDLFERQYEQASQKREEYRIETLSASLWDGSVDLSGQKQPGLNMVAATEFSQFLTPEPGAAPVVPDFDNWKRKIDMTRAEMGIEPDTDKARSLYLKDYQRFDTMLRNMEQEVGAKYPNQSLAPVAGEDEQIGLQKQAQRSRFKFLRMRMASTFGSDSEARFNTRAYNNVMVPAKAERGENLETFKDMLGAYKIAADNGISMDQVILNPDSPNGKRMKQELDWAIGQYGIGADPNDIMRDIATNRVFGAELQTDFFDRNNPLGWIKFNGGDNSDAKTFNEEMTAQRARFGISESDSVLPFASEYWRHYKEALDGPALGNADLALKTANQKVEENNIFLNGSIIPRRGFDDSVGAVYLKTWLKTKYPKTTNPTLVVVGRNIDGTALLAPRENGKAISNDVYRTSDLNPVKLGKEVLTPFAKEFQTNLEVARERQRLSEKKMREIGLPKISEPKF